MAARNGPKTLRFTRLKLVNWRNFRQAQVSLGKRAFFVGPNARGLWPTEKPSRLRSASQFNACPTVQKRKLSRNEKSSSWPVDQGIASFNPHSWLEREAAE